MKIAFALLTAASSLIGTGPIDAGMASPGQAATVTPSGFQAEAAQPVAAPEARLREFPGEYGTPATVIRAFYAALAEGQGDLAAMVIVPEKTRTGPFSAAELSRFYGALREPVRVIDLRRTGEAEYLIHYRYAANRQQCDGRAVVRTVIRERRFYIQGIRALNGC